MNNIKNLMALLSLIIIACGHAQSQKEGTINLGATDFKKEIETNKNLIILDVRTPEEVALGSIPNSSIINFYDEDFEKKIALIQKDKTIAVYCKAGGRSAQASSILIKNGFKNVINLEGGITAWEQMGFPIAKSETVPDQNIKQLSKDEFNRFINETNVVLVDFHTRWCSPCRKMAPLIDELEIEYKDKAAVKRIDCDQSKELVNELKISGVPVFLIYKKGKEVWRHNGMIEKAELANKLNKYL